MHYIHRPCELEMDHSAYMKFLLSNYDQLRSPYSFPMTLSFIASPLILGQAWLIFSEEEYECVGAFSVVFGTGERNYEDREICQLSVAYLQPEVRRTPLFARTMHLLLQRLEHLNPEIKELHVWTARNSDEQRLLTKLSRLDGATRRATDGDLELYALPFHSLKMYSQSLNPDR
ncbi:hypothetical protein [Paenibacillus sp. PL2-23]|uniref:hypothetical protein n=1 Tax=Paenibacillus sp. PL2-23 TaxID=2100729 RepID=UPI0030FACEC1